MASMSLMASVGSALPARRDSDPMRHRHRLRLIDGQCPGPNRQQDEDHQDRQLTALEQHGRSLGPCRHLCLGLGPAVTLERDHRELLVRPGDSRVVAVAPGVVPAQPVVAPGAASSPTAMTTPWGAKGWALVATIS